MENEIEDIIFEDFLIEVYLIDQEGIFYVNMSDFMSFCYKSNLIPNVRDPYSTDIYLMQFDDFCRKESLSFKAMKKYLLTIKSRKK